MSYDGIPDSVLAQTPAMQPPAGITPNFINPPSRNAALIALNTVFLALMVTVVSMRLYVKTRVVRTMGGDDYTCAIAAVSSIAHSTIMLTNLKLGYGRHLWDISALTLINVSNVRRLDGTSVIYPFVIYFVKLSILLLYLRLFGIYNKMRLAIYGGIVLFTLFYIAYLGVQSSYMRYCVSEADLTKPPCSSVYGVTTFQGAFNVASDFYVFFLPLPRLLKLHVGRRERIGLLFIFLAGFVACAVSIARLIVTGITLNREDKYWYASLSSEFTIVEINLAIIAACIPTMPSFFMQTKIVGSQLLRSIRSRLFESHPKSSSSGGKSPNSKFQGHTPNLSDQSGERSGLDYIQLEDRNSHAGSNRSFA